MVRESRQAGAQIVLEVERILDEEERDGMVTSRELAASILGRVLTKLREEGIAVPHGLINDVAEFAAQRN